MTHPSPSTIAARDELARLYAAPCLEDGDLARLPVLAAALGVAVRVVRVDRPYWLAEALANIQKQINLLPPELEAHRDEVEP